MDKIAGKKINKYKHYKSLVRFISKKNIFQKKSIKKTILRQNPKYFEEADDIAKRIFKVAKKLNNKINLEKIADIYLWYTDLIKIIKKFLTKFITGLIICLDTQ